MEFCEYSSKLYYLLDNTDLKMYCFLDFKSLGNLMMTSKSFYQLFKDKLRKDYYRHYFPSLESRDKVIAIWKSIKIEQVMSYLMQTDSASMRDGQRSVHTSDYVTDSPHLIKRSQTFSSPNRKSLNETKSTTMTLFNSGNLLKLDETTVNSDKKELKKLDETYAAILRDINRTFHFGRFTTNQGLEDLKNILNGLARANPDIGYCQGMNFVAAALLEYSDSVNIATDLFQYMLDYLEVYYLYIEVS